MRTALFRAGGLALALAVSTSLAACSGYPATSPGAPAAVKRTGAAPAAGTGAISINLSGLFPTRRSAGDRRTLAYGLDPAKYPIRKVRLTLRYPGQTGGRQTLVVQDWPSATAGETPALPAPVAPLTATVDAGLNRVVTVEALTDDDAVLMRLSAAMTVVAGQTMAVKLNFLESAVAQVIEQLMDMEQNPPFLGGPGVYRVLEAGAPEGLLHDTDLVAPLRDFLTGLTGFVASSNTFDASKAAPHKLALHSLAYRLYNSGDLGVLSDPETVSALSGEMMSSFAIASLGDLMKPTAETEATYFSESDAAAYTVSVIAPTATGWLAIENQPLNASGDFVTSTELPLGPQVLIIERTDPVTSAKTRTFRDVIFLPMGMVIVYPDGTSAVINPLG